MIVLFPQIDGAGLVFPVPCLADPAEIRLNFCLLSSPGSLEIIFAINQTIISTGDLLTKCWGRAASLSSSSDR